MSKEKLTGIEFDALKEVVNIAAGNATTALSNLLNKKIDIAIPEVVFTNVESVPKILGGMDTVAIGTYLNIDGDLKGSTLIILQEKTAFHLVDLMMGSGEIKELDEMSESALKEIGNILSGAYLNAMADFLELKILPTVPYLCKDMVGAMLSQVLAEQSLYTDKVLVNRTNLTVESEKIESHLIVLLDTKSMGKTVDIIDKKLCIQ